MPNISSIDKPGRSMDYSQLLEIRRIAKITDIVSETNPTNSVEIKPRFGMDSLNRGFNSGVIDVHMRRGLQPVFQRSAGGKTN